MTTRVRGALETLAAQRASGILEIDGDPAGTIYFDQGQITCARASWIPDIGARLLGALQPAEELDLLTGADEPDRDIGTYLVQRDYLTIAELATLLRSVVVDTTIALTALSDKDVFISDIRFVPAGAHWAAAFSCLDVGSVLAEARIRADRMARHGLTRITPVRLRDLGRPSAVLSRSQWALASAIDGTASAQDLAWRCGLALYETIETISALIAADLCQPDATVPAPPSPLTQWFGPPPSAPPSMAAPPGVPPALTAPAPLPRRPEPSPMPSAPLASAPMPRRTEPGRMLSATAEVNGTDGVPATRPPLPAGLELAPAGFPATPAPPDLLRRVLEGLRRS